MRRAIILGFALTCACRGPAPQGQLTFIAVGQGDCAVFQEDGYTILIDAGPKNERYDAGEKIVLPELRRMGIREIDLLILSHPDADHIGGVAAIAKKIPITQVVVPAHFKSHPDLAKTLTLANLTQNTHYLTAPIQTQIGRFSIYMDAPAWAKSMPDNDGSLFVWLGAGKSTAVFTGDAGIEAEAMMSRQRSWVAQVAHIGHHGSYSATSKAWIDHVKPQTAIVSCGRDNRYGHPHQQILDRLATSKIQTLRTDRDGTIRLQASPEGFVKVQ